MVMPIMLSLIEGHVIGGDQDQPMKLILLHTIATIIMGSCIDLLMINLMEN